MSIKQAFLILTHQHSDRLEKLYSKINSVLNEGDELTILYHQKDDILPGELGNKSVSVFTDDILHSLRHKPIGNTITPGNCHFALENYYLSYPHFDYYWYIEDDVYFNGNWSTLFGAFFPNDVTIDFLTSHIRTFQEEPYWCWWQSLTHPQQHVTNNLKLRSFNPIFRISNQALYFLSKSLDANWKGHYEVFLPTLLALNNYSLGDFGGEGKMVPATNSNKFYTDSSGDPLGLLSSGSFRYRPVINREEIDKNDTLYHPVKF